MGASTRSTGGSTTSSGVCSGSKARSTKTARLLDLGRADYASTWELQKRIHAAVAAGEEPDTFIVVEHDPTVTLGRKGDRGNLHGTAAWLAAQGVVLHHVERGGEATYHGPGQLVVYPIMKLPRFREVVPLVRALEGAVIAAVADFGVTAERWPAHAGVWVEDRCICAIGLSVQKMTSFHGIALNASTALDYDRLITPCGLPERGITSLSEEVGRRDPGRTVSWAQARDALLPHLANAFDLRFEPRTPERT